MAPRTVEAEYTVHWKGKISVAGTHTHKAWYTEPFLPPPPSIYGLPPVETVGCLHAAGLLVGRAETINNSRPHHHHPLLPHTPLLNLPDVLDEWTIEAPQDVG